jgi:hypothetical protein
VAINSFAVVAAVLGLASALAFVGTLFLIIGLAAVLCGVWALRQIRNSNGTQGGKGLAWVGIVLSVVLAGAVLASSVRQQRAEAAQARQVTQFINELGRLTIAGGYARVYAATDPEFQKNVTLEQFSQRWIAQQDPDPQRGGGKLREMYGNGLVQFAMGGDGSMTAYTQAILQFEKYPDIRRLTMGLKKTSDGTWQVLQMAELFEMRRPSRRNP